YPLRNKGEKPRVAKITRGFFYLKTVSSRHFIVHSFSISYNIFYLAAFLVKMLYFNYIVIRK
ncbi:MAG: hypothetical protein ACI9LN_003309, partial [Saprospiraceae bacterium]